MVYKTEKMILFEKKVGLALCLVILFIALAGLSVSAQSGQKVIKELVVLFSTWSGKSPNHNIFNQAAQYIDFAGMAQASLGENNWARLTSKQQEQFVIAFRKLVEQRYYPRWHKIFCHGHINYIGQTNTSNDTIVKTALSVGKKKDIVVWRLRPKDGELALISLAVNKTDLVEKLHNRFQKRLAKHNFTYLLTWLKKKLPEE